MNRRWLWGLSLVGLVGLSACPHEPRVSWSGYVEGDYVYVASPLAGAVDTLAVRRGEGVRKGATLFTLDADAERAAREEAAARLSSAQALAANTGKGRRREEIEVSKAQLAQAQAQAQLAQAELARQQQLVAQGFVSASRLDDLRAAARQAEARVAELQAVLRVAAMPSRDDERAAAVAGARAASAALEQARWREQQKTQTAPADGQVADTYFRVGEWVGAGQPVLSLLPRGAVRARFFVPEAQLAQIRVGQAVTVHCDGCAAPIPARIDFIATQAEYTPPVIYSNSQRARLMFLVEARPSAEDGARLKPGQPVDVRPAAP